MKQDEQISSMMGWISPEWTESLTNDYWSKGEAQRDNLAKRMLKHLKMASVV